MSKLEKLPEVRGINQPLVQVELEGRIPAFNKTVRVTDEERDPSTGQMVEVDREIALPALPSEWWMDPKGNVCALAVHTNADAKNGYNRYSPYYTYIIGKKLRQGWVPWEYAPQGRDADEWLKRGRYEEQAKRQRFAREDKHRYEAADELRRKAEARSNAEALAQVLDERGVTSKPQRRGKDEG